MCRFLSLYVCVWVCVMLSDGRSSHAGVNRHRGNVWLYLSYLLLCWHHQEFSIPAQQRTTLCFLHLQLEKAHVLFFQKHKHSSVHSFLLSILNQLQQIGQHKAETWLHYPPTLIWNECEVICLFGPAFLRSGPVWCFIYCHLHAQNSVNPLFVFKHLSCLLCVSLSPYWLLLAVCLTGCQRSRSGRQPAVGDVVWFQRRVTVDSRLVLSAYMAACPSVCLS